MCAIVLIIVFSPVVDQFQAADGQGSMYDADTGLPLSLNANQIESTLIQPQADRVANSLFKNPVEAQEFADQLLSTYAAALNEDFVIIFDTGGWGWTSLQLQPGWQDIMNGISQNLTSKGYKCLLLAYQRGIPNPGGYIESTAACLRLISGQAPELAAEINFMTDNLPQLKVILTGESTGCVLCDSAWKLLKNNNQVYVIETGPPFWQSDPVSSRILVLRSNGTEPDALSHGDIWAIIKANVEAWFGLAPGYRGISSFG